MDELREEYKDGIYIVDNTTLISQEDNELRLSRYFNLIDKIYEWIE